MSGRLSARESEVLALAACGLTHKEIAAKLGISSRTARNHIAHIYDKLDIHDRAQAALHAARLGLVHV
jgi:DNA-binding NarL/FixJ family response regulator